MKICLNYKIGSPCTILPESASSNKWLVTTIEHSWFKSVIKIISSVASSRKIKEFYCARVSKGLAKLKIRENISIIEQMKFDFNNNNWISQITIITITLFTRIRYSKASHVVERKQQNKNSSDS